METRRNPLVYALSKLQALLVDMDGVLYRGQRPIPGMQDFLRQLEARGPEYLLVTNNSSMTPRQYTQKLAAMGVTVAPERILTSSLVTAAALARATAPSDRILMVGGMGLREALLAVGLVLTDEHDAASYVVVGLDREVTYEKLARAALAIQRGAVFWGTNGDASLPSERGFEPGAGALLAALAATTGVQPRLFGKPAPPMFEEALARLGTSAERTGMIGDRYETDIAGAAPLGLVTIAVTTGVHDEAAWRTRTPAPDFVFPSIAEILVALQA